MPPAVTSREDQEAEHDLVTSQPLVANSSASSLSSRSSLLLQELNKYPAYSYLLPFLEAMSKPLPLTFRLRSIRHYEDASKWTKELKALQMELQALHEYCAPTPFDATIYQAHSSSLHKSILGKSCPALKELLVRASSQGLVARQELGSMLPVIGLYRGKHLKTNSRVLDACASPGSKTLQALEIVGPKGRVVANDVHPKRLETLQEAVQRSGMPHLDRLVFTNHDAAAAAFPQRLLIGSKKHQQPHVVVCDVPCSGDGTIRKDPTVLTSWSPVAARALHDLQCRILHRALEVVQVGGVVSYSTCSLNPVENEAVVQTVLCLFGDDVVELMEWPQVEGLTLRPGVSNWKVLDYLQDVEEDDSDGAVERQWKEYASFEEAKDTMVHCYPTLWPVNDKKNATLKRCRRLWPQDQDTGGFFVALLRKKNELPTRK
jgi:16S rRNA C967 or C1407 C5-methylase (RsmB/RsmF family)